MASNRVIAIDIGTNTAKIVELEQSSANTEIISARGVTYPGGAERYQITESIKQLWDSLGKPPTPSSFAAVLNRERTDIVLTLPRFSVNTKRLPNLPAATDEQLESIVAIAAETELPFRIEDAIFTYHDVQRSPEACSVELISTRRATVDGYLEILEDIGVTASSVTPSMIAIAAVGAEGGATGPTFIVDIGSEHTDFCFLQNGKLLFSRSFRLGGDHLSEQLDGTAADGIPLSADEPSVRPWLTQLVNEIQRSIAAAVAQGDTEAVGTEIWLCGEGARLTDLATACETAINIPTRLWDPVHALRERGGISVDPAAENALDEWGDTLAVALGAGLSVLNSPEPVSLLPKETAETLTQTARHRQVVAAAGLGVLIIGGIFFGGYTLQRSQRYRVEEVESQLAYYERPVSAAKAQIGKELALTDMLAHHISPLDILYALSEMFGDRTQVAWTNFNITNLHDPTAARITFNLEGSSHNAINTLLRALDRSGVFQNIRPGEVTTLSQNRQQVFQVQVRCNLTPAAIKTFAQKRYPMPEIQIEEPKSEILLDISPPTQGKSEDDGKSEDEKKPEDDEKSEDQEKQEETE